MNISDFGTYDYRIYDYTFLNNVVVTFSFTRPQTEDGINERMKSFSSTHFDIQSPEGFFEHGLSFNRSDKQLSFSFTKDFASFNIDGGAYKSFADSIIPFAFKLRLYVKEVIGLDRVTKVSIRKVNLWQFEYDKSVQTFDTNKARKIIFSQHFNELNVKDDIITIDSIIDFKHNQWTENCRSLELKSGFVDLEADEMDKKSYGLFLDSEGSECPQNGVKIQDIDEVLQSINSNLYNAYMWCISDKVKTIMEKGKEA